VIRACYSQKAFPIIVPYSLRLKVTKLSAKPSTDILMYHEGVIPLLRSTLGDPRLSLSCAIPVSGLIRLPVSLS